MRTGKSPRWSLAAALLLATAGAQAEESPSRQAVLCSNEALSRYATTSPDPAPVIAKAAFDACQPQWNAAVEAMLTRSGLAGFDPWLNRYDNDWMRSKPRRFQEEMFRLEGSRGGWKGFEEAYVAMATRAVFELRARGVSPAPKKAPAGRDY